MKNVAKCDKCGVVQLIESELPLSGNVGTCGVCEGSLVVKQLKKKTNFRPKAGYVEGSYRRCKYCKARIEIKPLERRPRIYCNDHCRYRAKITPKKSREPKCIQVRPPLLNSKCQYDIAAVFQNGFIVIEALTFDLSSAFGGWVAVSGIIRNKKKALKLAAELNGKVEKNIYSGT